MTEVTLPVEFKGKTYMCLGVRAWFDNGKLHKQGQIVKGGIRFLSVDPQTSDNILTIANEEKARKLALDDVMALGLEMLAKNAGTDFAKNVLEDSGLAKKKILKNLDIIGGAKGVIVAPKSLHDPDHNEFVTKALKIFGYKLGLLGIVGWDRDVPAGDIGTTGTIDGSSVLDGFVDGYAKALKDLKIEMPRHLQVAVCTGKTADNKYLGNPARPVATGFGTVEALRVWAQSRRKKLKDLVVVFDGAGNAALPAAKFLVSSGIKVVGMTDSRSVILQQKGFTSGQLEEIALVKAKRGSLKDWGKGEVLRDKVSLWKQSKMNVLFVSSDAMIINSQNVSSLPQGILIVDGANGPVTPLAEEKLASLHIDHLTGSYANSGGVIGSLIEWSANIGNMKLGKEETLKLIRYCLRTNFLQMKKLVDKKIVDSLADAFYYRAMEKYINKLIK